MRLCSPAGHRKALKAFVSFLQLFIRLLNDEFMIQLQGVGVIVLWTLVFSWIALKITSFITPLRVDEQSENEGLDLTEHNETGYQN